MLHRQKYSRAGKISKSLTCRGLEGGGILILEKV